jgi:DNA recombination protein RmuC
VLEKVKRQLNSASRTIEDTGVRTRAMERRLRSVEQLPEEEAARVFALPTAAEQPDAEEPPEEATTGDEEIPF